MINHDCINTLIMGSRRNLWRMLLQGTHQGRRRQHGLLWGRLTPPFLQDPPFLFILACHRKAIPDPIRTVSANFGYRKKLHHLHAEIQDFLRYSFDSIANQDKERDNHQKIIVHLKIFNK